jgi:UPF0716 protein FxsA
VTVDGARFLIRFLDRDFVVKLLFVALLYALLPLAEIVLILYLGEIVGKYVTLAAAGSTALVGVLFTVRPLRTLLGAARARIRAGTYPQAELVDAAGYLVAGLLFLAPGFITDAMGAAMFVPPVRRAVGRLVTRKLERRLLEAYEYLRLYDL